MPQNDNNNKMVRQLAQRPRYHVCQKYASIIKALRPEIVWLV